MPTHTKGQATAAVPEPFHTVMAVTEERCRLWRFSFDGQVDNAGLARHILAYRRRHPAGPESALKCWQSGWQFHRTAPLPALDALIVEIERAANAAIPSGRRPNGPFLRVVECWAAVSEQGQSAPMHGHGKSHFSGVYYVSATGAHPGITFTDRLSVKPVPGTFLMFDGRYRHRVPRQRATEPRIVVAVNITCLPPYFVSTPVQGTRQVRTEARGRR